MSELRTIGPGWPWHHHDELGSTNDEARRLAESGAPHGTVVTAELQRAGRGRQGRSWVVPRERALTVSVLLRDLPRPGLLPLAAGVAVADVVGERALLKWPNDVVLVGRDRPDGEDAGDGALRKVAGILAEGRPAEGWSIVGIGLNVAVDLADLPADVASRAATLGRDPGDLPAVLDDLVRALDRALALEPAALRERWSARDVLRDRPVGWTDGAGTEHAGTAVGIDDDGRLVVRLADGHARAIDAGDVHLAR